MRGQPRDPLERGSGDPGGARGSCRLQASASGVLHRPAKAAERDTGSRPGALIRRYRRPLTRRRWRRVGCSPRKEHDRERQRLVRDRLEGRIRPREGALPGGLFDREPTGPSRADPKGNRRTSRARPKLWARRQASLHPRSRRSPTLRPGERPWKPPFSAKARGGGDSGIERFNSSARVVWLVAEVGTKHLPCQGEAHRKVGGTSTG